LDTLISIVSYNSSLVQYVFNGHRRRSFDAVQFHGGDDAGATADSDTHDVLLGPQGGHTFPVLARGQHRHVRGGATPRVLHGGAGGVALVH